MNNEKASSYIDVHVKGHCIDPNGIVQCADCTYNGDTVFLTVINREEDKLTGCALGEFDETTCLNIMQHLVNSCGKLQCLYALLDCIGGEEAVQKFIKGIEEKFKG